MVNQLKFTHAQNEFIEPIEQCLEIAAALSGSWDLDELLSLILSKSRELTNSDAGSIYLLDRSDGFDKLLFKTAQNFSRPDISFEEFAIPLTLDSLAGYVAITGNSLNLADAYEPPLDAPYCLNRNFDLDIGYCTKSVLALPMQDREGEIIGVLQLINRKTEPDIILTPENLLEKTQSYSDWEARIVQLLASQAGISIERQHLQQNIENLFEGFIRSSVRVIEARDPCTKGHSERVADLTIRLAEEVSQVQRGSLRDLNFSRAQLKEIRYAALLHDFGKIGVPEAILVKEKKLYPDRLEVLRNRFSLVQRTLEMECAQQKYRYLIEHPQHLAEHPHSDCPHCQKVAEMDQQLETAINELDEYWRLILDANEPQILTEALNEKLFDLTRYTYIDVDGLEKPLVTAEELLHLSVQRGNLTPEERIKIEAHVSHSFEFLRQIPWTKDLAHVPDIVYAHHEKLDGTGYPRQLKQDEIPVQTQMMTICDIFDALTAGDRPYKVGLPIEQALKILHQEAEHFKLRGDMLDLFEQREVYRVCAKFLDLTY